MAPKNLLILIGAAVLLVACGSKPPEPSDSDRESASPVEKNTFSTYSAAEFFKTVSFSGSTVNHDNTAVLVSSDESGVFNVYRYPIDGSAPTQLTHSTTSATYEIGWFPKDDRVLYTADEGGNELHHIFVREHDGKVVDLTPGESLKAQMLGWRANGETLYLTTNERNPKTFDLYAYATQDYTRELVYQNDEAYALQTVSPDGKWLAVVQNHSNANTDIFLIDLTAEHKEPKLVTAHQGDIRFEVYTFTPDSRSLIYGTDEHGEFRQAWSHELATGETSLVHAGDWDVVFVHFSKHGKYRVVGINQDARTVLTITEMATQQTVSLPPLPEGDMREVNFSGDEQLMAFFLNSDTSPTNLFVHRLGGNEVVKLTQALNPAIGERDLVASEVVRFRSFDGLEIPGLLYKPRQAHAQRKVPALILIHGGPGGQSRKGYNARTQHLVNHGYAIFAVNNRGSSGYGKTFFHLDDKKHGEVDLQDIVYGKKYLQSLDWIDGDKIGVMGGSYGGFLTMAAMAFTQEFEVGINLFGVTNWERTINSIPPWWESIKKYLYDEMGDPATDGERHRRISPLFHAQNITKPVLIVQGANDPRVLQIESDEMVAEIRKNNVPVEYVLFEDEGHGFRKKSNRIVAQEAYLTFLKRYL